MQRLGPQDTLMVAAEAAGWLQSTGSLAIYDDSRVEGGLTLERLREYMRLRIRHIPIYRQRLVSVPGNIGRPSWVEVDGIDITQHVTEVPLPHPGSPEQVATLVGGLLEKQMDMTVPLWHIYLIRGLQDGTVGVFSMLHHAASDAVRGQNIQAALYDLNPDGPLDRGGEGVPGVGSRVPGRGELLFGAARELMGMPGTAARAGIAVGKAGVRTAGVLARSLGRDMPGRAPRVRFNAQVGAHRTFAYGSIPLAPLKAWAKSRGGTVNDGILTLTGGALRRYLDELGELPAGPLLAAIPVGHVEGVANPAAGGNSWSVMTASIATDVADPDERMRRIIAGTVAAKRLDKAMGPTLLGDLMFLPPVLTTTVAGAYRRSGLTKYQPPTTNVTVSNVRGSPVPIYMAGAELLASHPFGPVADGMGLNLTLIGYQDHIDIGISSSPDIIEDLWEVLDAFRTELEQLINQPD